MKTLIGTAFLLLVFALVVAATRLQAQRDLAVAWDACTSEREFVRHVAQAKSPGEIDLYMEGVLTCVERNQSMLARFYFDRAALRARWERDMRPEIALLIRQFRQADEYRQDLENLQDDVQSSWELEEFRRQSHRSGDPP